MPVLTAYAALPITPSDAPDSRTAAFFNALDDADLLMARAIFDAEIHRRAESNPLLRVAAAPAMPICSLSRAFQAVQGILRHRDTHTRRVPGSFLSIEVTARDITVFQGSAPIAITNDIGDALREMDSRVSMLVPRAASRRN
ncbi:hypothetical protein Sp245p_25935 (plasmid) [Azospirillum baldaniorum]|uniref:Uncharacterized protein n=1 Tax=Azospirillum baldaniorum TaxID=1064539 RepID=A0A9P1JZY0_9PROT|nr:hypothetical protein [Azospirillum baldaniorum]AWJ93267.1 hypothetical protein Sp245p_25935 [Azospirillum baldaniorum]TWA77961.1 hypothetical protein FBZ85_106121 [Azospirillum brasilense]CCD02939.1 protein of unknown function [Azospirillum baldaniorum]